MPEAIELTNGLVMRRDPLRYSLMVVLVWRMPREEWVGEIAAFGGRPHLHEGHMIAKYCTEGDAIRAAKALAGAEPKEDDSSNNPFRQYLIVSGKRVVQRYDYRDVRNEEL